MIDLKKDEAMRVIVQQAQTIRALEMSVAGFLDRERKFRNTLAIYEARVVAFADAWEAFDKARKVGGLKEEMPTQGVNDTAIPLCELAQLVKAGKKG